MHRKVHFLYLISPMILEWMITYGVQIVMLMLAPSLLEDALICTMIVSIVIALVMGILYRRDRKRQPWEGGKNITVATILGVSMLGVTSCIGLNLIIGLSGLAKYSENYQEVSSIIYDSPRILQFLAVVIIAPMVEELVYRGLIYRRMREMGPVLPSVLISAIIFGINHGNLVQFVFATAIGGLLALAYEEYRNISIPIIMHMAVNFTSLIWTWVGELL